MERARARAMGSEREKERKVIGMCIRYVHGYG